MANTDCEQILNLIPSYIDNTLSEKELDIVSRHLDLCENCRKEFKFMKSIVTHSSALPEISLPTEFHEKLMLRAEKIVRTKKAKNYLRLRRIGAGVAAAAVVAFSVVAVSDIIIPNRQSAEYISGKLSDTPVSLKAPQHEKGNSFNQAKADNTDRIKPSVPSAEKGNTLSDKADENSDVKEVQNTETPADLVVVAENEEHTIATISVTEDTVALAQDLLSSYEKDDIGYIIPDIDVVVDKLLEYGFSVSFEKTDSSLQNYIIIK